MLTRLCFALFLGMVLICNGSALHADQPQQIPASPGFLLVASKQMPDPRFQKTVLVVTTHGSSGPIGIIVNRPRDITLDMMFPDIPQAKKFGLFYGGPVYPGQISYLVRGGQAVKGALTISSNIYLAYDMPTLGELVKGKRPYKDLRVMHGLASWAPGQLEYEINQGGWYVMPFDEVAIFDRPPAAMWLELYNRANSIQL